MIYFFKKQKNKKRTKEQKEKRKEKGNQTRFSTSLLLFSLFGSIFWGLDDNNKRKEI